MSNTAKISELDELKLIYFEILDGYSYDSESGLYIKHFSERESALVLRKREELFHFYANQGVPHEADLLKRAIATDSWSQDKEDNITSLRYEIADNERNIHNIIPEQRAFIEGKIQEARVKLADALNERKYTLGRNIEDLIDDDVNDYVVYLSFYKDKNLKIHLESTYEDFQNYEQAQLNPLNIRLNFHYRRYSEEKLKAISALPLLINKLSFCKDNITTFIGKTVFDLTHNQNFILQFGVRNCNILANADGNPPDPTLDASIKMADVVRWYDVQHSINIGKKNNQKTV